MDIFQYDCGVKQEPSSPVEAAYWEDEDDVFYAHLRKQVLKLTDEGEDDYIKQCSRTSSPEIRRKGLGSGLGLYYDWVGEGEDHATPAGISKLWRNSSSGTGVFIPQISIPVRSTKYRQRRKRSQRSGRGDYYVVRPENYNLCSY